MSRHVRSDQLRHRAFDLVVLLKGLNGALELAGGTALLLVSGPVILAWVNLLTRSELSEDPRDFIAGALLHWAEHFGRDSQFFVAAYLLFHGVVKVSLAFLLLLGKSWAYPVAIIFFSIFVGYAGYRLSLGWSFTLAGAVAFDVVTIAIIAREWIHHP